MVTFMLIIKIWKKLKLRMILCSKRKPLWPAKRLTTEKRKSLVLGPSMVLIFLLFEQGVPHSPFVLGPPDSTVSPVSGRRQREMNSMCLKKILWSHNELRKNCSVNGAFLVFYLGVVRAGSWCCLALRAKGGAVEATWTCYLCGERG